MHIFTRFFSLLGLSRQCCYPPEWEADEILTVGTKPVGQVTPSVAKVNIRLSWDAPLRRFAYTGTSTTNGRTTTFKNLADYISNVNYQVIGNSCNVTSIQATFNSVSCIPDDAQMSSPAVLGLGQLKIYQYNYNQNNFTYYSNMADGCVPVSFTAFGVSDAGRQYMAGSFENLTVGIKDRSVFNIPTECRGVSANTFG